MCSKVLNGHIILTDTSITTILAPEMTYTPKITGSLEGKETGSAECFLINGSEKLSDWKKVDLSALGKVDCLTFSPASNEANAYGLLVPAYFAIDEIGLIAEK